MSKAKHCTAVSILDCSRTTSYLLVEPSTRNEKRGGMGKPNTKIIKSQVLCLPGKGLAENVVLNFDIWHCPQHSMALQVSHSPGYPSSFRSPCYQWKWLYQTSFSLKSLLTPLCCLRGKNKLGSMCKSPDDLAPVFYLSLSFLTSQYTLSCTFT